MDIEEREVMEILTLACPDCQSVVITDDIGQTTEQCPRCDHIFSVVRTVKVNPQTIEKQEDKELQKEIDKLMTPPKEPYNEFTDPKHNKLIPN